MRAILDKPQLIILDEPTSGLDYDNALRIIEIINNLGPQVTKIMTTHSLEDLKHADGVC